MQEKSTRSRRPALLPEGFGAWPPASWTWSLSGPPPDTEAAILRDVWIDVHGAGESLLLTVSQPDAEGSQHTALIPVEDRELRRRACRVLSTCLGRPLADLGDHLRLDQGAP